MPVHAPAGASDAFKSLSSWTRSNSRSENTDFANHKKVLAILDPIFLSHKSAFRIRRVWGAYV
jgi:hypothetical protein